MKHMATLLITIFMMVALSAVYFVSIKKLWMKVNTQIAIIRRENEETEIPKALKIPATRDDDAPDYVF